MRKISIRSYSSSEMIAIIEADGWEYKNCDGDHHQFVHKIKHGKVTVPHPKKDLPKELVGCILKQAGLR